MPGDRNPNFPPGDDAPGSTMVAVPRLNVPAQPAAADPGGTMVGIARIPMLRIDASPRPPPPVVPEAGGTMVGVGRVQIGGFRPPGPAAPPQPQIPEDGGTMVGMARPSFAGSSFAPNFGNMAMPMTRVVPEAPRFGAVVPPSVPTQAPEAGGTMVGIPRVGMPPQSSFGAPPEDVGGTMVGIARVGAPAGRAFGAPQQDVGGTMVGIARVGASMPFGAPANKEDVGGTMVGMARVGAPPPGAFGAPSEDGGTMVGIPMVGGFGGPAAFGAPPHPEGPPPAYEIIAHLGGGELGEVYHARRSDDGIEVALRVIRPEIAEVEGAIDALRDVVALAANAQHTHLGNQIELDETASPTLVVEYVAGKQLASLMKNRGLAPPAAVVDLGVRLCSALAAAHAAGLAHGRVHAGNVVLEANTGRWVMLDLGHGYATQGLEPSHDLYALGAMLYEMATGHSPFEAGDVPPDPRTYRANLPASLSALLLRTTSPNPAVWFGSAIELAQALSRARNLP